MHEGSVGEEVCLAQSDWSELLDIHQALYAALRSRDLDEQDRLEILKSIEVRYSRCLSKVLQRLGLSDPVPEAAQEVEEEGGEQHGSL